ncbi:50S ribosomal protein L5 [Candidatus Woesearchaeota archaeon]|nr:50S ribosomal protein L5 [Candidatus Woesearchaeota archaeon]
MNPTRNIRIEKITLNIGAGKDQSRLDNALVLLKDISEAKPVKTVTNKRLQEWGLRPGLPIGCKVTLRKKKAKELLARLLDAKDKRLKESQFDDQGNISFGIAEYIDIKGAKYDPKIGIMGLEVCVTLERAGYRIKKRRLLRRKVPKNHRITKEEAIDFMKKELNVELGEE